MRMQAGFLVRDQRLDKRRDRPQRRQMPKTTTASQDYGGFSGLTAAVGQPKTAINAASARPNGAQLGNAAPWPCKQDPVGRARQLSTLGRHFRCRASHKSRDLDPRLARPSWSIGSSPRRRPAVPNTPWIGIVRRTIPRLSWLCSCSAEMPLECVAIKNAAQTRSSAAACWRA